MTSFDNTDPEWNDLCMKWLDNLVEKFKELGIYDRLLELCGCEQEFIQIAEPTIDFEELYDTFKR